MQIFTQDGRLFARSCKDGRITAEPIDIEAVDALYWFWYNIPANDN